MSRLDYLLLASVLLLAALVGASAHDLRAPAPRPAPGVVTAAVATAAETTVASVGGTVNRRAAAIDRGEVRRRLRLGEAGTYIGDLLASHDSSLARWPERTAQPLRVWVQPRSSVRHWRPAFADAVRQAFTSWEGTGIPVHFTFVLDSATADVHVTWIDRFREPISGKTLWARDARWWIVEGNITLAVHHSEGDPLDLSAMRAIALHEVGHLIGLDHTPDTTTIMTPRVRVRELAEADRATARLLYTLPPGQVR